MDTFERQADIEAIVVTFAASGADCKAGIIRSCSLLLALAANKHLRNGLKDQL